MHLKGSTRADCVYILYKTWAVDEARNKTPQVEKYCQNTYTLSASVLHTSFDSFPLILSFICCFYAVALSFVL